MTWLFSVSLSPDLEVFEALRIHFVEEEVWQLLAQLVEAEEETLDVAELQFGLLICSVLSVLHLLWWQRHELLHSNRKNITNHGRDLFVTPNLVSNSLDH